ncbi:MAG: TonB-dependent receptor [Prevotella sp.]|nr:TonB-dependent receptor [Prevotella sp.]
MKKTFLFLAAPIVASMVHAGNLLPAADDNDSLRLEHLQEVVVRGVNAQKNAPFAVANIKKTELQSFAKTGKELPFLFSQTPGILAWSENGVGTGTTYMRIRGAGGSRINVTLDGVPLNSPEDQCVFWANMNSYASLLGKVQIQRGVGTSTNGDGAFGGTIALSSKTPDSKPSAEVSASYGSYNTYRVGGAFSTGLLWNHLILDGAYHETNTDGYIHGTQGRSGSYYGGLSYAGDRFALRYKLIGNFERTGQAWNGVTAGNDDLSLMDGTYGEKTGIKTYKDLYKAGLGRYNSLYEHLVFDDNGYHTERHRMADGSLWKKTTDNFWQHHHILSLAWDINEQWATTASLHYTHGYGYYDEFRYNNKLSKFGLANITDAQGNTLKRTDFVRKKGLTQDTYGAIWNISYKNKRWDIIGGLSVQQFDGNHFGYITYVKDETLRRNILGNGDYQYYDSDAKKFDGNAFLKALYHLTDEWDLFADAQYRHVSYKTDGVNDKFYDNGDGTYVNQRLDINEKYNFFNPKAGISFHKNGHQAYASAAISNREPERNNFTDNGAYPAPKAERLFDYEVGYSYSNRDWRIGVNLYYMDYKDQFVQTGQQSDIGENLTTNIKRSYRMGIELSAGCNVTPWLSLEGNAALSQNKVKDFDEYASVNWDDDWRVIHYDNSTLAFSPSTILNGFANFHYRGFQAVWHTNFVSRQYLDNTENKDRSLPGYSVTNLSFSYTAQVRKAMGVKGVVLGLDFNNIFARRYATSGWVYSSIVEEYGHPNDNRYYQIGFIPAAGFTAMGSITLKF